MDNTHLSKLKKLLHENNLDAALISSLPNIYYLTGFDYFSDIDRDAFLLITKNNNYIFTNGLYYHAVTTYFKNFDILEISINNSFTKLFEDTIKKEKIKLLGIEENNITVAEYKSITSVITSIHHLDLKTLRIMKTKKEIEKIKKACIIGDKAFSSLLKEIKLGITEKEVETYLKTYFRNFGSEPSFTATVAFGENAAIPHHKTSNAKLKKNDLILLDFGVKYENYCSDMTRTIFFGKATKEQRKVYETVREAQEKAIEQFNNVTMKQSKPIKAYELDKTARSYIIDQGYPSIPHSLGHGIGLQVHEAPRLSPTSKETLSEGMVFSIEPGIYLNDKFGIRIEDLFTIKNGKLVQLTKSPRKLIEI